ncbi:MAG: hypothetical protein KDI30_03045, partial [Pseudomonadales bacterium]|nr:hypothetical protein [Pseudomonadales bacterium]
MAEPIVVSSQKNCFEYALSHLRFVPLGFNYDHDEHYRLIEDYWDEEWHKVENDFLAMKALGANVVRIHLQVGKFLQSPFGFNQKA